MIRISTVFILTLLLVLGVTGALLLPSAAQADCAQWDLSGHWQITQANGFTVTMDLAQTGTDVQGSAHASTPSSPAGMDGSITGTIDNNGNILLNADWGGVYRGGVGSDAFIGGTTFAVNDPGNQVGWRGDRTATCQFAGEPSATTPPSHAESPLEKSGVLKNLPAGTDIFKKTTTPSVPPPPTPPPPFCGNLTRCNVLKPSDVFDAPAGNQIAELVLPANTADVCLLEAPQQDNTWFHVKWSARPEGGWVFSGPGYENAVSCP